MRVKVARPERPTVRRELKRHKEATTKEENKSPFNPAPTVATMSHEYHLVDDLDRRYQIVKPDVIDDDDDNTVSHVKKLYPDEDDIFMWVALPPTLRLQAGIPEIDSELVLYEKDSNKQKIWAGTVTYSHTYAKGVRSRKSGYVIIKMVYEAQAPATS